MSALRVIVDVDRRSHEPDSGNAPQSDSRRTTTAESINACIRVAASVCESMHRQHAWVECIIGDKRFRLGSSQGDLRRTMDAFASVPVDGITADTRCSPCDARGLFEVHVTTGQALRRGPARVPAKGSGGLVVVSPSGEANSSDFSCQPWLEVSSIDGLDPRLPQLWRRACNVA